MGGGRKKRGGFLFRWMRSDLPDREEDSAPVVLLSVKKTNAASQQQQGQPPNQRLISDDGTTNPRLTCARGKNSNDDSVKAPAIRVTQPQPHRPLLTQLNERFRKTLSLDSRSSNRVNADNVRPKSMVVNNVQSFSTHCNSTKLNNKQGCCSGIGHISCPCVGEHAIGVSNCKEKVKSKSRFRPKSFFSLENFLDSRRSDTSSADDFSSSKYRKFYLDSAESSPVFRGRTTPDLLDLPAISSCSTPAKVESNRCKKRLDKLENHFNRVRDLRNSSIGPLLETAKSSNSDKEPLYSEPFYSSHSTLVVGEVVNNCYESLDSVPDLSTHVKFQGFDDDEDSYVKSKTNERDRFLGNTPINRKSSASYGARANRKEEFDQLNSRNYEYRRNIRDNSSTPSYEIHIKEDDVLINDRTRDLVVKTMDKSVDSIGSCSLDVDAENTDYSDTTSGSLNILTPSAASCQRDFTSRLQDRACRETLRVPQAHHYSGQSYQNSQPKKPSYLHLACSVNGYSNITTYDSKLRQKLNKSREASPGRPGNTVDMLRDCTDDAMAQRLNSSSGSTAANQTGQTFFKTSYSETSISSQNILTFSKTNGNPNSEVHQASKSFHLISNGGNDASPSKSFIQQRVERLYGPGALAQGFFNQQRQKTKSQCEAEQAILNGDIRSPESMKAQNQQNSYTLFSHTFNNAKKNGTSPLNNTSGFSSNGSSPNCDSALPVLRHLRPEFRAQLPMLSPKRSLPFKIAETDQNSSVSNLELTKNNLSSQRVKGIDVVDRALAKMDVNVDRIKFENNSTKEKAKSPLVTIVPMEICTSNGENMPRNGETLANNISVENSHVVPISNDVTSDRLLTNIGDQALKNLDNNCNQVSVPVKNTENKENVPLVSMPAECVDLTLSVDNVPVQNGVGLKTLDLVKINEGAASETEEHGGLYFLELKRAETERLIKLAESAERDLEQIQDSAEANEEVLGFLRSAAGKARLLATQKMQQFEGLCHNNLNRREDEQFPTTCQDLQGFWDMVSLQVVDITQLFKQLEIIREGGWKEVPSQKKQIDLQPTTQSKPSSSSQISKSRRSAPARVQRQPEDIAKAKERDERRKQMMADARRKAAEKLVGGSDMDIEVFEPASKANNLSS